MKGVLKFLDDWLLYLSIITVIAAIFLFALVYPMYLFLVTPEELYKWSIWEWLGYGALCLIFLGGLLGIILDLNKKKEKRKVFENDENSK